MKQLKGVKWHKNNKIIIYLKRVTRKLNKHIEDKNEREYKKLKVRS